MNGKRMMEAFLMDTNITELIIQKSSLKEKEIISIELRIFGGGVR